MELYPNRAISENSWVIPVSAIQNTDLSVKNPNKQTQAEIESSAKLFELIETDNQRINGLIGGLKAILA